MIGGLHDLKALDIQDIDETHRMDYVRIDDIESQSLAQYG